ncbi:MAG: TIGR03032 family protein [Planctomycetes bacterium]|nr:TIGR03032 family protein [Planctomycetota bacterium]
MSFTENNESKPEDSKPASAEESKPDADSQSDSNEESKPDPLRSVHTNTFPELLAQAKASVLVTTYQAGKLVVLRNDSGVLNTHFRNFMKPMGLAVEGGKLAIGCNIDIWEFHNVPAVCPRLDATDECKDKSFQHDACYLPRRSSTTGDIAIHEMAWVDGTNTRELVFVNTAFSCLSTRSGFEPIWRPHFIDRLAPGDCCHLNGMAVVDGKVRYVTALGDKSTPGSWRENKRDGGILMDVPSNEIIVRGLSMPHSPRWYRNQLWLLESGQGTIGRVDLATGKYESIAQLPGFTRGLSFIGPLALIGLSQVRESAVFSDIPLVERLEERTCGVWVVNIETGETVAFCKFEEGVQEIFAVELLLNTQFPDLVNHDAELIGNSYVLGDDALKDVPENFRS